MIDKLKNPTAPELPKKINQLPNRTTQPFRTTTLDNGTVCHLYKKIEKITGRKGLFCQSLPFLGTRTK